MPTVHREVEAKYDADPDFEVPSLVELFGAVRGGPGLPPADGTPWAEGEAAEHHLSATYFDTARLDLAAAGLTLRRRTGGDDAGWHLKVPAGDSARSEIRFPLGEGEDDVPDGLLRLTHARSHGRPLVPVARITTDRTVRRLVDPTGRVLAEVADDRVTAERVDPGGAEGAPGDTTTWREVEVEVVDGPPELLAAVDPLLRERGLTPSATGSKLVRTLGTAAVDAARRSEAAAASGSSDRAADRAAPAADGKARPRTKASAGDVALAHLRAQVAQVRAQDLPVRLDLPGAVHAMRVATRRLRSTLTTFEPLFHGTVSRPVARELKWLAGVLGAARDAEVMRERLITAVAGESPDARLGAAVDGDVRAQLDDAYRAAHDEVVAQLDGDRYRALLDTLDALLEHPPFKDRAGRRAREVLPRLVAGSHGALRTAMDGARSSSHRAERETLLHDARKAAKRARYAAEAVVPVFGKDARRFAVAMERVQEALGEHLESLNARDRLHALAARASDPGTAFTLGRLHAMEEMRAERSDAEVGAAWSQAGRKRLRRWLR